MGGLRGRDRARLPDSAFAYIDSKGRRLLPINDAAHVRNALARFGRVDFEDEAARDQARLRLLRAARRHGVSPLGFVAGQLEPHRRLPTGQVTLLLCDIEGSTRLLAELGEAYAGLRSELRRLLRGVVRRHAGREVDARADELFAAFGDAAPAVEAAIAAQREIAARDWPAGIQPLVRMGVHTGRPALTSAGYVGLAVHAVARLCAVAHGGQVVVSQATARALGTANEFELQPLGEHRLAGLPEPIVLLQVVAQGLARDFPSLRTG